MSSLFRPRTSPVGALCVLAVTLVTGAACRAPMARPGVASPPAPVATLYDTQRQIADYIDSGRYDADFAAVATAARAWLEDRAPRVAKPAIVLDIDETSLSNWP